VHRAGPEEKNKKKKKENQAFAFVDIISARTTAGFGFFSVIRRIREKKIV
jgi:hypothetical protein